MTKMTSRRLLGALAAASLLNLHAGFAVAEAAASTRILEATDHAELAAEVSADAVVRVALVDDRIARVIRAPGAFAVEHDPAAGDLYLLPIAESAAPQVPAAPQAPATPQVSAAPQVPASQVPVVLFVGSERGLTYRLTLTPMAGGPAQILIRNSHAETADPAPVAGNLRIAAIAGLVRAVANGTPPEGYAVEPGDRNLAATADIVALEFWRGPRYEAGLVALGADAPVDAAALAALLGPDVAAVWIAGPAPVRPLRGGRPLRAGRLGAGSPAAGRAAVSRLAVVVRETGER